MESSTQQTGARGGCLRSIGRVAVRVGLAVLGLLLISTVYQAVSSAADASNLPAPGRLVDVGGRKLHIGCTGQGSPTVILEGGAAEWSIHWQAVQPQVAGFARVCSYDRAGYGWSDPAPGAVTAGRIADDLRALLQAAGEKGPYVLVGHSMWGMAARLYQSRYPDEVAGLVLVETLHEDELDPTPEAFTQSMGLFQVMQALAPVGAVRILSQTGVLPLDDLLYTHELPETQRPAYRAAYNRTQFWAAASAEIDGLPQTVAEMRQVGDLGDLPLIVIRAGDRPAGDWPPEAEWQQVQARLAALSTRGAEVVAGRSGHYVQLDQPEVVIDAIREVVEMANGG
jgi:pimeloyl-ACP methyl ester carboxylesterase